MYLVAPKDTDIIQFRKIAELFQKSHVVVSREEFLQIRMRSIDHIPE